MGGVGRGKKKFPKKSGFFFWHNGLINPLVHGFEKTIFFISKKKLRKKNSPYMGGVVPQVGLQGGGIPPGGTAYGV